MPQPVPEPQPTTASVSGYALVRDSGPGRIGELWIVPSTAVRVGRDTECFIALPDAKASRAHVTVSADSDGVVVTDLGSSNGTFLNESRIGTEPAVAKLGDRLRIGDTTLVVKPGEQ